MSKKMRLRLRVLAFILFAMTAGCAKQEPIAPPVDADGPSATEQAKQQLIELYEAAKQAGDNVPDDLIEWAQQDISRIGDWEYRVVSLTSISDERLEEQLNEIGTERWEVFWVQQRGRELRFFMKRPAISHLRSVPFSDLRNVIPGLGSD